MKRPIYTIDYSGPFEWPHVIGFENVDMPPGAIPLDGLRALTRDAPDCPGLYFLWRGPQLLYIGYTACNIERRTAEHVRAKAGRNSAHRRFPFTHYTCVGGEPFAMSELERDLIKAYNPPLNNGANARGGRVVMSRHWPQRATYTPGEKQP